MIIKMCQRQVVTVEDLEGLMVWQDPLQTGKIFGAGLYFLICLRHLVNGLSKNPSPPRGFILLGSGCAYPVSSAH